ncbi:DUF1853 family protein [Vibrio thalassae]|nr:DUF1853 family protein [Vibrio thalassae]
MNIIKEFSSWIRTSPSLVMNDHRIAPSFPISSSDLTTSDHSDYEGNPRLGFLYQELCRRQFEASHPYRVVAEELQLQQDNRTIGAIDFVLENLTTQQIEHWEVAIKFYLLKDGYWYGPNAKDRLDKKLHRMLEHQLMMTRTAAFQSLYPDFEDITQHLLMQGRLYINPFENPTIPEYCLGLKINPKRVTGFWCYQSQFDKINEPVYLLTKPLWATGLTAKGKSPVTELPPHFIHCQSDTGHFWFVVPNDWPQSSM